MSNRLIYFLITVLVLIVTLVKSINIPLFLILIGVLVINALVYSEYIDFQD
jgi:hypothetical protein